MTNTIERFWSLVEKTDDCWIWRGSTNERGYGCFKLLGEQIASRVSFVIAHGHLRKGLLVCHRCDNPGCVRPDHLFAGTHRDNADDMVRKGRSVGKIKPHQATAIRNRRRSGERAADLAAEFGIRISAVRMICTGRSFVAVA